MSTNGWIHCNICFHSFERKERKFYHLSCRHVLCKLCMAKTNRGTMCPLCKKPLERFTELNNQMERKEKMYYDPGSLKVFGVAYQSVIFQHKQREDMIRGILRCRSAVTQMKEMENAMRQKIMETQRRYEKFRTHRRNLQEGLRQISPRYGSGPTVVQGAGCAGRTPLQPLTGNRASPQLALANRDGDPASRRYQDKGRPETVTFAASPESSSADFSFGTPAPSNRSATVTDGSFTPAEQQHARLFTPQASNERFFREGNKPAVTGQGDGGFADDSGISSMQTPTSSLSFAGSSRMAQGMQQQQLKQQQLKQQQLKQQQLKQQQLKQQQQQYQQLKQQQQQHQQHQQHQQLKQQQQQHQQLKQQRQHPYTPSTPARHLPGTSSYRHSQIFPPTVPRP
ncbi:histone-lysine N-methyltransferase 2D isoform X2 [Anopheles gambiae]|uniref:histone-lysine N-methyltransferase 2D-like n=1 Tax=Anopheles coluzzii TaxID=1518534 RepID=UPI0020FFE8D6|nr:histone-lysine N-methyltransferase 2D-like [Anopheles coluzzii]XP_565451.3 histone-lysine N-methyltransferase 2D isoform X2 [Anopheles gambiae]